ncbi:GTP cyclohydrolase I FolE [Enterococcus avium]
MIEKAIEMILIAIGEDTKREGLIKTPERVARMYEEVFSSVEKNDFDECKLFYSENEKDVITLNNIEFYSMCEHHLLPFFGHVHIAYVPNNKKVCGLSKIVRMIDYCSKRPSIQENLTYQIAKIFQDNVQPKGIAVAIEATHLCMAMRGVKSSGAITKTSHFEGVFNENDDLKRDFLRLFKP